MLFGGYAKPSFGWYKVTKNSNEATTTNIRLPGSPKLGTSLIIMSPSGSLPEHSIKMMASKFFYVLKHVEKR